MKKILVLKNELKVLAEQIRQKKADYKTCQKEHHGCDGYYDGEPRYGKWIGGFCFIISKLKYEFRHKHIAYCLLRGRVINEIETPAENNKPNELYIKEIFNAYTENVCVGSQRSL